MSDDDESSKAEPSDAESKVQSSRPTVVPSRILIPVRPAGYGRAREVTDLQSTRKPLEVRPKWKGTALLKVDPRSSFGEWKRLRAQCLEATGQYVEAARVYEAIYDQKKAEENFSKGKPPETS